MFLTNIGLSCLQRLLHGRNIVDEPLQLVGGKIGADWQTSDWAKEVLHVMCHLCHPALL